MSQLLRVIEAAVRYSIGLTALRHAYVCIYVCMYVYGERERARESERAKERASERERSTQRAKPYYTGERKRHASRCKDERSGTAAATVLPKAPMYEGPPREAFFVFFGEGGELTKACKKILHELKTCLAICSTFFIFGGLVN